MKTEYNKKQLLNLFADFILGKISPTKISKIEIADFENFIVVKGNTSSSEILDLSKIRDEFSETYKDYLVDFRLSNTIDLINYGSELKEKSSSTFTFYNSSNPSYEVCLRDTDIDEGSSLIVKSEFPHGYSLNAGRDLYLYAKHIAYNVQFCYIWDKLRIKIYKNNQENLEILINCEEKPDEKLKSVILDYFDFNYEEFRKLFYESDWVNNSFRPEFEYDFVKKYRNLVII